ncbi:hypothetical protein ACEWY4_027054 [Coilia grayii]|uniref:Uncharacterized protein n=1 Tax=Coilia grayii TaxID=363190 RepID=A0ABD1IUA6_9TELE
MSTVVYFRQKKAGRKKIRKENSKLHREIQKLKSLLKDEKKQTDKYRKRLKRSQRNSNVSESPRSRTRRQLKHATVSSEVRRSLLLHHALMANIKDTFTTTKKKAHRRVMSQTVTGKILKKYGLQKEISKTLHLSIKRKKSIEEGKMKYRSLCYKLQQDIVSFLTRDESSRLTAGKAQTITRGKKKKQKRFLNHTLKNLHRKFLTEYPQSTLSYSLFCRLRPFWVVHPTVADRETCLCKVHENFSFLAEKLHSLKIIKSVDLEDMLTSVSCSTNSKDCMYNVCPHCKGQEYAVVGEDNLQKHVLITQWSTETVLREKKSDGVKEMVPMRITAKLL